MGRSIGKAVTSSLNSARKHESDEKGGSDGEGEITNSAAASTSVGENTSGSSFFMSPNGSACSPVSLQVDADSPVSFVQRDGDVNEDPQDTLRNTHTCDWP